MFLKNSIWKYNTLLSVRIYVIMSKGVDYMIKLTNVTKVYKTGVRALNDVNLTIGEGEFVYVIGTTGAGKSTFIKLIYREEKATKGYVEVVGRDVTKIRNRKVPYFRRNIGVVFQNFRLLPKKTVFENVAFALEVIDTPRQEIRRKVRKTLELVGLESKVNAFPHELSGGQQQRVAIARAIVNNPKILIADEPTGNLDPETSKEIIEVLERINREQNTTVLVVTHDREVVQRHKKRTILMEDGCINTDTSLGGYVEA
jgi:cell division transport system ATP-binding protein